MTHEELQLLALDRGSKLDLPDGVRHVLILIEGDRFETGGAGCAMAREIENPAEMLEAGAEKLRELGFE